jgi:hypothetical protein
MGTADVQFYLTKNEFKDITIAGKDIGFLPLDPEHWAVADGTVQ